MPELEESVTLDLADLGSDAGDAEDTGVDPFESLLGEVLSRGDEPDSTPEPEAKTETADPAEDAGDAKEAETPADPNADKPAAAIDEVDPQESDLHKEGEKSWVEPHKWKAMLNLKNAAKVFATEPDDGGPITVRAIRESLEQFASIAEVVKSNGLASADDLKETIEAAEHRKASVAEFQSEDPRDTYNFLDQWRSVDPDAFARLATALPDYLVHAQPEALSGLAERLPELITQLDGDSQFRVMDRIVGGMSSDFEAKAREFATDHRLSEEDRATASRFYVNAIQAMEYSLYGKHRTPEQILGYQVPAAPTQPDPRDEQLRRMQEEQARDRQGKLQQFQQNAFAHVAQGVSGKINGKVDELLKPYAEAKFPKLVMDSVREKVERGIKQTVSNSFRNDVALAERAFNELPKSKDNAELRHKLSTLVEVHATIVNRATAKFKNSPEFAALRKELAESRKVEVQKREAVQNRAPAPASNPQAPHAKVLDVRNAETLDEGVEALLSRLDI